MIRRYCIMDSEIRRSDDSAKWLHAFWKYCTYTVVLYESTLKYSIYIESNVLVLYERIRHATVYLILIFLCDFEQSPLLEFFGPTIKSQVAKVRSRQDT